ncbi:MAG: thioredoxin family protein [Flavobacteriales bacterium]|nr:thioredoxin family protein [Flavobacteriales bacterium]
MALVTSSMMELGAEAPSFVLPDTVSGKPVGLPGKGEHTATVVLFICNHCPYVHHINARLVEVANSYQAKGVRFLAISSNNVGTYPQDGPEHMARVARELGYPFPYLYDENQEVARAYEAACTPDLFVFDSQLACTYRGRFDPTRPNMGNATGADLTAALDALLEGRPVSGEQFPSMGCSIKWK